MDILIFLSEFMVPLTVFYIVGSGILAKRPVFDDFLDGAKEGMRTVADVLPTLIGLMTAVGVLRASGILEVLSELLKFPAALCHIPVPVIPIILVRIISSSAAVGLILDIFKEYGPDSLVGNMVSIMMGCTETVFYTMSVYFMSAHIRKTRWTLPGALVATAADSCKYLSGGFIVRPPECQAKSQAFSAAEQQQNSNGDIAGEEAVSPEISRKKVGNTWKSVVPSVGIGYNKTHKRQKIRAARRDQTAQGERGFRCWTIIRN